MRTAPMTLYNLSKDLGCENRFDECIKVCERGILLAKKTGRCQIFPQTLYNKAWALIKRNRKEDSKEAKELANQAFNVANALGYTLFAAHCKAFIETNNLV